jgi:hypothetical protein
VRHNIGKDILVNAKISAEDLARCETDADIEKLCRQRSSLVFAMLHDACIEATGGDDILAEVEVSSLA